jgi:cytochrome c553
MKLGAVLMSLAAIATPAMAADIEAGRVKVAVVCAACHGANGVSVSDHIPNLAAQRAAYLAEQLASFKAGTRKSDIMNVIAPQLTDDDVANVAAFFEAQTGAMAHAKSDLLPNIAATHVTLPADFSHGYVRYLSKDSPEDKSVAVYYANDAAFAAAGAGKRLPDGSAIYIVNYSAKLDALGKPVHGDDGKLIADQVQSYVGMASGKDWGKDIPEMLRNENWNYAVFAADRRLRANANQAECLACHKPKQGTDYLFLRDALSAAARTGTKSG